MDAEPVSLLAFLATAFAVFAAAGVVATRLFGRGAVAAGRRVLFVVWFAATVAVGFMGYRQYGFQAALPAAMAVGLSVAIVYAITRRGMGHSSWLLAAVMGSLAALLATALLPLSLLLFLAMLGIDGP